MHARPVTFACRRMRANIVAKKRAHNTHVTDSQVTFWSLRSCVYKYHAFITEFTDICDQCQTGQICTETKLYECESALTTLPCPAPTVTCSGPHVLTPTEGMNLHKNTF